MKILEIQLSTNDLAATEVFYTNVLELKVSRKTADSLSFKAGDSIITFTYAEKQQPACHFAFNIPSNLLDKAIDWIKPKVELINESDQIVFHFESWNATAIYFNDNNGNILEFIARVDLKNEAIEAFDSRALLSVSEIALVTENPLILAEELAIRYSIPHFSKGPQRDDFTTLGDDNGLLIIPKIGRKWFSTQLPAEKYPLIVKIAIDNRVETITFE